MPYSSTTSKTTSAFISPDCGLASGVFSTIIAKGLEFNTSSEISNPLKRLILPVISLPLILPSVS